MYDPEQNAILVKKGMDAPDIFRCVSLEVANVQLVRNREGYSRETEGYKAYAVSYMLCKRYGVDAQEYDISPGLTVCSRGKTPKRWFRRPLRICATPLRRTQWPHGQGHGPTRASRQKEQER